MENQELKMNETSKQNAAQDPPRHTLSTFTPQTIETRRCQDSSSFMEWPYARVVSLDLVPASRQK